VDIVSATDRGLPDVVDTAGGTVPVIDARVGVVALHT